MKKVKIYALTGIDINDIRYIGKTELSLEKRLYYHIWDLKRCTNKHKVNWINSLLLKNEKPKIILIDEVNFGDWKFWEKYWISQFKTWGFNLLNYTDGGEGYSSEDVKKLWENKEYREFHTNRVKGEKNPFFGKHHNEETKKILRDKCPKRGKDNPNYGKMRTVEENDKMRLNQPALKGYIRLDLDENIIDEWVGLKYMCRELMLDEAAVLRVIKGKRNHHKGFKFKYK